MLRMQIIMAIDRCSSPPKGQRLTATKHDSESPHSTFPELKLRHYHTARNSSRSRLNVTRMAAVGCLRIGL
jgi:hypothetical protein